MISSNSIGKKNGRREFSKKHGDSDSKVTKATTPMPAAMAIKSMALPPTPGAPPTTKNNKPSPWTPLGLSRDELELDYTLPTGQSFRWRKTGSSKGEDGAKGLGGVGRVYTGVVGRRLVQLAHVGDGGQAAFRVLVDKTNGGGEGGGSSPEGDALVELLDYFNAGVSLSPLAARWASSDARWRSASRVARGARVLRQPPLECLLSFVCSSNNSIPRITGMVEHLAREYGTELASAREAAELLLDRDDSVDDVVAKAERRDDDDVVVKSERRDDDDDVGAPSTPSSAAAPPSSSAHLSRSGAPPRADDPFYAFPTLDQLAGRVTESDLRDAGFGYRARYIVGTIEALASIRDGHRGESRAGTSSRDERRGDDFLLSLRGESRERALDELAKLPGVGPKVAACVALFSLDKHDVVPVDTHVWQLAARHYVPSIRGRPFSPAAGNLVSAALADKFGPFAGWAHNALFIAELPGVRDEVLRREREERRRDKRKGVVEGSEDESDDDDDDDDGAPFQPPPKPAAKKRTTMAARRAEEAAAVLSEMNEPGTPSKEV